MTVSNKTMERIMRQDSNLSPYDGFIIGGIGKVLNQIGLNQRKHHIIYKVSSGEFAIPIEFTGNVMEIQLIPKEEILEELNPIKIPRIGGVDIIIKDHPVLDRTTSSRIEYGSRMSFSEDRITGYKGKEKDLARVLTPQEIRQPVIGRYEGMLEIAGHEFLVAGVAGRENGCMTLGLSFLEDHKPWGRKEYFAAYIDSGSGICTAKPGVFPKEARETLPVIAGRDFSQKNPNTQYRNQRSKNPDRGEHLERPGSGKRGDFDAKLTNPKMQDKRKFGKVLLSFRQQGLIDSDSLYEESEEEIKNLREALVELKTMDISEESILSLENVKRLIQRNFSENPLAWWDRNKIEATLKIKEECKYEYVRYKPIQMNMEDKKDMQIIIKEHINLGLIEPGISAYSSPGFLVRNHGEIKRGKPRLKWRVNQRSLLHSPHHKDEDELVVYTDANDYRWAAVLMKKTTTGEEPCRYIGGLFTEQQAQVWHINEKEFFAVWKAFKKWPLFLLAKEFTLKVDNTNVKAFLKNKLESKIEKAQMEGAEANSVMLRLRHLRENLEELDREFGRLAVNAQVAGQVQRADLDKVQTNIRSSLVASTALWNALLEPIRKASPSVMTRELREQGSKPALRVQGSRPVAADSSTACTRPSSDSGETATDESQGVKTSDDSCQPSTSG
ncbi:hypothetical protein Sango_2582300 [Sesamum angolense]|uniref:Reverse transcriptase RNase H-like domain-containing protein n=1 Tax=Sesamum angolense TaxID=2727404 RepID=A0AAE1W5H8_9LAMI|nr:hypothetical protein Sango_2582300 [Sesamum angolense]